MTAMADRHDTLVGGSPPAPPGLFWRWAALLAAFALLAVLVTVVAPGLPRYIGIERDIDLIKDKEIRAGAYYYTEVDQVPAIEAQVQAAMRASSPTDEAIINAGKE
jgi:hypothetical protein